MSVLQMVGITLLIAGLVCIVGIGIHTLEGSVPAPKVLTPGATVQGLNSGGKAAPAVVIPATQEATIMSIAFLLITLSWPLIFPNMLRSSAKGEVSSIRTIVFMLVAVFILLAVRSGWTDPSMEVIILGSGWVSVLGIAFGAKTLQYFGENPPFGKKPIGLQAGAPAPFVQGQGPNPLAAAGPNPGPAAGPNLPPAGLAVATGYTGITPIADGLIARNAGDLPIHFHDQISSAPPAAPPPAIQKALAAKTIKTKTGKP